MLTAGNQTLKNHTHLDLLKIVTWNQRELETREHSDLQWPNIPQAQQLPCLEGKSERPKGKEQTWTGSCRRSGRAKIEN